MTRLKQLATRRNRARNGAAVVEFAFVCPVLILLIFGSIEYGRMVMVQQLLVNASRQGARLAILPGATTTQVKSAVTTYLGDASVAGATATVNPDPPGNATYGTGVTVSVSIPYKSVSWLPSPLYLGSTTLSAKSVMRTEQAQSGGS